MKPLSTLIQAVPASPTTMMMQKGREKKAAGFDVINPVQTNCRGMEPEGLKRDFGRDICFWGGGCDTKAVLPKGTPEEVKDHVKSRLEVFLSGGGFVFNTVHNILPEVPPQNIVAMYEAVAEFA